MKKIIAMFLLLSLIVVAAGVPVYAVDVELPEDDDFDDEEWINPFDDVNEDRYYFDAVKWASISKITAGTTENTFSPASVCTRAQVVTFLWRASGSPSPQSLNNQFTDVSSESYYYNAVLWAVENGITVGTSQNTFSPGRGCSRAEAVTFLWRSAGSPNPISQDTMFVDIGQSYYRNGALWAYENGITFGTSTSTFSPNELCDRGQIVTFLYRLKK